MKIIPIIIIIIVHFLLTLYIFSGIIIYHWLFVLYDFTREVINIKKLRIFLIILLAVILVAAGVAIWQRDNIKALYMGITQDKDDLADKRKENDKIISSALEDYSGLYVRDLTEEERIALAEGKITKEQLALILQGKATLDEFLLPPPEEAVPKEDVEVILPTEDETNPPTTEDPPEPPSTPPVPQTPSTPEAPPAPPTEEKPVESKNDPPVTPTLSDAEVNEQISALVGQMYILKAEFVNSLKNLENTTLKEYASLSDDQKTSELKTAMMNHVLDEVSKMEKDCDTQVEEILTSLTKVLTDNKKDTSLVTSMREAYKNEKTITKAEYINTYFK